MDLRFEVLISTDLSLKGRLIKNGFLFCKHHKAQKYGRREDARVQRQVAVTAAHLDGAIGKHGRLPWQLPSEVHEKFRKRITKAREGLSNKI